MAAFQRGRKPYYRSRRRQRRPRKIQSRRRKLNSRRRKKARTKRITRFARSYYRKRRLPMSKYFNKRMRDNVLSSQKAKYTMCAYRSKACNRKPSRVGRPRKRKYCTRIRSDFLQCKLKKGNSKKRAKSGGTSAEKKAKRKAHSEDEVFYSIASPSVPKAISEEKPPKKNSVRFNTPPSPKIKEEPHSQEEAHSENQQSQQTVIPKKRSRLSANPTCKSR